MFGNNTGKVRYAVSDMEIEADDGTTLWLTEGAPVVVSGERLCTVCQDENGTG